MGNEFPVPRVQGPDARPPSSGTPDPLEALLTPLCRAVPAHPTGRPAAALGTADGVCAPTGPRALPIGLRYAEDDGSAAGRGHRPVASCPAGSSLRPGRSERTVTLVILLFAR
ncbi:hypothetical protein GCM10019016_126100 [Streptomyces prasinosporus]|uniref:Uncharacterized protein n=1 Tax=Streptomyces prasinosporus TaxID=68256 RepID=A0ABP6UFT5_9ACTN|nr:hypothetical protein GCM10010332_00940 [Streptomyces albogriseolus]